MLIRAGTFEDSTNLSALAIQVWLQTYATDGISSKISRFVLSQFSVESFDTLLAQASTRVFVAVIGDNLVGYAVACIGSTCSQQASAGVELAKLYVQEPFVGQGIGSRLLEHAESCAVHLGSALWLTVNSKNVRAIAFYTSHGYSKIGMTFFKLEGEKHENLVLCNRNC
jgi:diamine N-acetyltransferase